MEAGSPPTTGSRTIADLLPRAAEQYAQRVAIRHKVADDWVDVTFSELGDLVSETGRGLIDLGLRPGERVSLLADTRPEWTVCSLAVSAAGGVVVPVYPSNSPEECEWVVGNSESIGVVCENSGQLAKILEVRERLPLLRFLVVMDGSGEIADAVTVTELRARGRALEQQELVDRYEAISPDDPYTFIYTSGTTGPPKGCVLTHRNYRSVLDMIERRELLRGEDDVVYLFLPLAHAFALVIMLLAADTGTTVAYWTGDTKRIIVDIGEIKPTYLPSVPRIFEKLYTLVTSYGDPERIKAATQVGLRVRALRAAGEAVPPELERHYDQAEESLFKNVRAAFGGRLREAVSGAAPIAKEILEFFWACGVPVVEGYGMTETATVATVSSPEHSRLGSVGLPLPGVEVRTADDGEILIKGANIFRGYHKNDDASFGAVVDGWLHTGDLGRIDEDGFVFITGRKKDIIITAGGKNLTPANLENDMKQCRWVSQAVMHGDRRPYPVMLITLDEEEIVPWAQQQGIEDVSIPALARDPRVVDLIQTALDEANERYARVEQVKRFFILDHDLTQETGELTPTLKVKRNVVGEKYAARFDALYDD
ncbi:MAG: AMP-dependent synthetase/ligase [Solirubrobacteraceae bacterium]|nr:AMP-dependent synthetase/ligase [Solirubrobacteraceae bacterium]